MAKPRPRRGGSADCVIIVDGEAYHPHEDEWIEVLSGVSVGELQATEHIRRLGVEIQALQGEPDEQERLMALLDPHYEELTTRLAERITAWSWTDDLGRPLGDPTDPATLKKLRPEELYYLVMATQGQTPGQRKNV